MVSSTQAGRIGPICIFVSPNDNKLQRIETAFCSIQLNTNVTGKSFNPISNNSVSAVNISAPTIASLHCPKSINLGIPSISPKSKSLNRYFPQPTHKITVSSGNCFANSVK